jgi:hypothetical protein
MRALQDKRQVFSYFEQLPKDVQAEIILFASPSKRFVLVLYAVQQLSEVLLTCKFTDSG